MSEWVKSIAAKLFCESAIQDITVFGAYKPFDEDGECGAGYCVEMAEELVEQCQERGLGGEEVDWAVSMLCRSADRWFFVDAGGRKMFVTQAIENALKLQRFLGGEPLEGDTVFVEGGEDGFQVVGPDIPIEKVSGMPPKILDLLTASSTEEQPLTTARQVLSHPDLTKVKGVGASTAVKIREVCEAALGVAQSTGSGEDSQTAGELTEPDIPLGPDGGGLTLVN